VIAFSAAGAMENRFFFPQDALDQWIVDGMVDVQNGELLVVGEGRRYKLAEAVRVVREVSGSADSHDLVGHVKARQQLERLGAEIIESSMLLGDAAYDVDPGWVAAPILSGPKPEARSDVEILGALLRKGA
jgi:hypothetical protein